MNWDEYLDLQALMALRWPAAPAATPAVDKQAFNDLTVLELPDVLVALDRYHGLGNLFPPTSSQLRRMALDVRQARLDEARRRSYDQLTDPSDPAMSLPQYLKLRGFQSYDEAVRAWRKAHGYDAES